MPLKPMNDNCPVCKAQRNPGPLCDNLGCTYPARHGGTHSWERAARTGAERYLEGQLDNPEYRSAYEEAKSDLIDSVERSAQPHQRPRGDTQ